MNTIDVNSWKLFDNNPFIMHMVDGCKNKKDGLFPSVVDGITMSTYFQIYEEHKQLHILGILLQDNQLL